MSAVSCKSIECLDGIDKKSELSANIVAFISCRSKLTKVLAGATKGIREVGEGETD